MEEFRRALPDFEPEDNVGSPYCVRRYVVDDHLGGPEGLAIARLELSNRGMNLILDFVPNHVAPDHPWVAEHPEYFIRGNADDAEHDPSSYINILGTGVCLRPGSLLSSLAGRPAVERISILIFGTPPSRRY